jgi:hypothetical protein
MIAIIDKTIEINNICWKNNIKEIQDAIKAIINGSNLLTINHCSINNTVNNAVAANSIPSVLKLSELLAKAPIVQPSTQ